MDLHQKLDAILQSGDDEQRTSIETLISAMYDVVLDSRAKAAGKLVVPEPMTAEEWNKSAKEFQDELQKKTKSKTV